MTISAIDHLQDLYGDEARLRMRTQRLRAAKVAGGNPVIAALEQIRARDARVEVFLDIACGRGSSTARVAEILRPEILLALDLSRQLLDCTRSRVATALAMQADFHNLPIGCGRVDAILAAFCLYHSQDPVLVCREIARCLAPGGVAVLVTKSAESYQALDNFVARIGLDSQAERRASTYQTFCSENAEEIAGHIFSDVHSTHEMHRFRFATPPDALGYIETSPKYVMSTRDNRLKLLEESWPEGGLEIGSMVSIVTARH